MRWASGGRAPVQRPVRVAAVVLLASALGACGEPPVDLELPAREAGQHVLDQAGVLDAAALQPRLTELAERGLDVVALAYETEQASCGEAFRAGGQLVSAWDADVAVVAVARPGDFTSTEDDRRRCIGVQPRDTHAVSGAVREEIAEELVPPLAAANDWDGAFAVAVERLAQEAGDGS